MAEIVNWITELVNKERSRQTTVAAFHKAAPEFIDTLVKALQADVDAYVQEQHFTQVSVDIKPERDSGRVGVFCSVLLQATVYVNAGRQQVVCSFQDKTYPGWQENLVDDKGALRLMSMGSSETFEWLSRKTKLSRV